MNSDSAAPRGRQTPRVSWHPKPLGNIEQGKDAVALCEAAGLFLDDWQRWFLETSLAERSPSRWTAFEVGLMASRQNGKNVLIEARELAGLFVVREELIIHSAHLADTSNESFQRLLSIIEENPFLDAEVAKVSRGKGTEGIQLKGGPRIRFRTRTTGGGRGFSADCLILDEAMIVPDAMHAALLPTLSARPNPQVWYTGSAVDQRIHEHGAVFSRIRGRGHRGDDDRLFYAEWSAADSIADVSDEMARDVQAWARANPALGIRIDPGYIADEHKSMSQRAFAVERLGAGDWPTPDHARLIDLALWDELKAVSSPTGSVVLAIDVSPTRSGSIAAGWRVGDEVHLSLLAHEPGTAWMAPEVLSLVKTMDPVSVTLDAAGPAGSLLPLLEQHDFRLTLLGARELGQACGAFFDALLDKSLRHDGNKELRLAVEGASRRSLGEAWAWSRKSSAVDISPLVAVTLAHWAARTSEPAAPEVWSIREVIEEMREEQGLPPNEAPPWSPGAIWFYPGY